MKISEVLGESRQRTRRQFLGESLAGCWVIALIGFSGYVLHFNSAPVGFLFLLVVVTEAILCGFWQATIVSILACACLDYFFYPPIFVFSISDPQDWVSLGAFEISALVVSRVSSQEQRSSREATFQRTAMEQLYELSRSTLLINLHRSPGPQLTELILRIFGAEAVSIFDANSGSNSSCGSWREHEGDLAKECFFLHADDEDPMTRTSQRLLRNGNEAV